MSRILIRRGNKVDLPALNAGEPGFALDTKELYIGTSTGNQKMVAAAPTTQTWIAPTLLNGWVNYGSAGFANAGYYKDDLGIVRLRGLIKSGTTTTNTILFVLPAGYRPSASQTFTVIANNGTDSLGRINVDVSGNISLVMGANAFMSLDSITFRTEQ